MNEDALKEHRSLRDAIHGLWRERTFHARGRKWILRLVEERGKSPRVGVAPHYLKDSEERLRVATVDVGLVPYVTREKVLEAVMVLEVEEVMSS